MTCDTHLFDSRWSRVAASLTLALILFGCNSESAQLWQLTDPGGGGAAPAIYAVPDSDHLFVSSDVGGIRYSPDAGESFRVINEGLDFSNAASDNFQDLAGYRRDGIYHVIGSATAGLLYWRSIGPDGLAPAWQAFFDARGPQRNGATALGALAVDDAGEFLYAGIGNSNNLALNRLARVDPGVRGKVFYFQTAHDAGDPAPPEAAGTVHLGDICTALEDSAYLHVSDLAAVTVDGTDFLYAGTTEGLLIITGPRSAEASCRHLVVAGRNPHVLAVQPNAANARDVVVLLNEGGMERRNAGRRGQELTLSKGGVFHTRDILATSPGWENLTPAEAQGKGLGGLERSRRMPQQLVLSGDAQSSLGLLYTPDLSADRWTTILDRGFASGRGRSKGQDGWRRAASSFRGVKEVAIADDDNGLSTLYVSGFQGRLLRGRREGGGFRFDQAYTRVEGSGAGQVYRGRGVPLMNPWRSFADPRQAGRTIFLYHDNLMFVSDDGGESFRRPVEQFGWGTDAVFDPGSERIFIAWSRGNHLESGRREKAESGGLLVGTRRAGDWNEISPRLPARGPVEALTMATGQLCANVYRNGVFCTPLDSAVAWRRATPEALDVLHLLDADDGPAIWVVAAAANQRRVCRIDGSERQCSELPVKANNFERLWIDNGRLWLSTGGEVTYTSAVQSPPDWKRLPAAVTDVRTISLGTGHFALIAGGADGLFASRKPVDPATWCQLPLDGLQGNRVIKSIADPAGGDFVYVAAAGVGFYRASIKDLGAPEQDAACPP